jgi:hypothetical protein
LPRHEINAGQFHFCLASWRLWLAIPVGARRQFGAERYLRVR